MSCSERPSFVAQLLQAYTASLEENKNEACFNGNLPLSKTLSDDRVAERKPPRHSLPLLKKKKKKERTTPSSQHPSPPTSSVNFPQKPGYHILGNTIEAWEQISDIASEVAHSVMAKEASLLCETGKRELALNLLGAGRRTSSNKRRKVEVGSDDEVGCRSMNQSSMSSLASSSPNDPVVRDNGVVTSDDEDDSSAEASTLSLPSTAEGCGSRPPPGVAVVLHIERMGRLSTYISEMERYHRLIRAEMENMEREESNSDFA
jgi:hypothetical protein